MAITTIPGTPTGFFGSLFGFRPAIKAEDPRNPLTAKVILEALDTGYRNYDTSANYGALRLPIVKAAESAISNTVSQLPLVVYSKTSDGNKEKATTHPLYRILHDAPNDFQTAITFWDSVIKRIVRTGNAYIFIERTGGNQPGSLILLDNMKVQVGFNGTKFYVYDSKYTVADSEMIHLFNETDDGMTGISILDYCSKAIYLGLAIEDYSCRFFSQGSAVGGTLEFPGSLTPDQFKQIRDSWEAAHSGLANSHKTAILPFGGKYQVQGHTNESAQLIEMAKWSVSQICRAFRIPPSVLGHMESGGLTYSNVETQNIAFLTMCIKPWCDRISQELNKKLFAGTDFYVEHQFTDWLQADIASRYGAYDIGFGRWLTANDIRRAENLPDVEGGDELTQAPEPAPAPAAPAEDPEDTAQGGTNGQ